MTVPANIRKQAPYLRIIGTAKKDMRNAIISAADKRLIDAICECCKNSLHGNINHSEKDKRRLRQYKRWIKTVMNKKVGIRAKKKILRQKGGFLPMILGPLINGIGSVLGGLFGSFQGK